MDKDTEKKAETGCNYCLNMRPADQIKKIRLKVSGRIRFICSTCREERAGVLKRR